MLTNVKRYELRLMLEKSGAPLNDSKGRHRVVVENTYCSDVYILRKAVNVKNPVQESTYLTTLHYSY